jgi:phosphoheptose isomerase
MLFQSTITQSGVTIKNMTNTAASKAAINAIVKAAKEAGATSVSLTCTHDGDMKGRNASSFSVWSGNDDQVCSVDNDGVTY